MAGWRTALVVVPDLVTPFLLTVGVSFLIGIGLRGYYESESKFDTFGTVRTFVFIGMLGFVLFQLPGIGSLAFLVGLGALALFLLVYYGNKVLQKKSPGMIGVLIALLTYATGPIALQLPQWYLVLLAVSILLVLHSKGRIRQFTDRLETGEVVTACKFLAIVGVVLPLIPATMPTGEGPIWRVLATLPVTPRQIWLAVVVTTGVSYLGYVLQTYLFPRKGLELAGLVGGLYSSTVTVLVLAKKSKAAPESANQAATAVLLAVSMMYLRLLVLVAIFRLPSAVMVGPALVALSSLAAGYALWLRRLRPVTAASEVLSTPGPGGGDVAVEPALRRNPLELNAAVLFAVLFAVVAFATKYVLEYFKDIGLRVLSFVVGFSDITPFVVSLLQGSFGIGDRQIVQAVVIASASNNVLKMAYTYVFGSRRTANLAAPGMIGLVILSMLYAVFGL
jgi:uncharacterized membrane protein (DUF4010 family)